MRGGKGGRVRQRRERRMSGRWKEVTVQGERERGREEERDRRKRKVCV